jgi:hypothetical protein
MAAITFQHSRGSGFGAFCRRLHARLGVPKAITATAHKLACLVYDMLKHGTEYFEQGKQHPERRYQQRVLSTLSRRAQQLGYRFVKEPNPSVAPA